MLGRSVCDAVVICNNLIQIDPTLKGSERIHRKWREAVGSEELKVSTRKTEIVKVGEKQVKAE